MSFAKSKSVVEEGDTVVIYLDPKSIHTFSVVKMIANKRGEMVENIFQTKYGALKVKELIGRKYGYKVSMTKGWGYLLHPNPELWTLTLPHRTQILYTPDISLIIMQLELKSGSVVVESGTGSGSLSHAILRAIAPKGHLHTFDFHQQRVEIVTKEFEDHGLGPYVTVRHKDVCKEGFELENVADGVFLDLPSPWLVVHHATSALKRSGGRLCSFSPCIEQSQKMCEALSAAGFMAVETIECLQREHQVKHIHLPDIDNDDINLDAAPSTKENEDQNGRRFRAVLPPLQMAGHTGYLTFATWPRQPGANIPTDKIDKEN